MSYCPKQNNYKLQYNRRAKALYFLNQHNYKNVTENFDRYLEVMYEYDDFHRSNLIRIFKRKD